MQKTRDGRKLHEGVNNYLPTPLNTMTRNKVKRANLGHDPTLTPSQKYGKEESEEIISFEHMN